MSPDQPKYASDARLDANTEALMARYDASEEAFMLKLSEFRRDITQQLKRLDNSAERIENNVSAILTQIAEIGKSPAELERRRSSPR